MPTLSRFEKKIISMLQDLSTSQQETALTKMEQLVAECLAHPTTKDQYRGECPDATKSELPPFASAINANYSALFHR